MKFFFDNNIARHIALALNALGDRQGYPQIVAQRDFASDSPLAGHKKDWEWFPVLASEGDWVVISGDVRISTGLHEKAAWLQSGLTAFFLGGGWADRRFWEQTCILIRWWPQIVAQAQQTPLGAGYVVPLKGTQFQTLRVGEMKAKLGKRMERFTE